ncbi:uncharacterized protein LOC135172626 [Diachasmimorpha longicaudata]|uniref:uncharacterized protein LOC135172626 n=1 Tax=Diachasmimorpha longicaudata TaxID=58733 RepID=UPI0030B8E93C
MNEDVEVSMDNEPDNLRERLKIWALENIANLKNKTISQVLEIFRDIGHSELPRTAEALLGTCHYRATRKMKSSKGSYGAYAYCGIKEALLRRIDEKIYKEDVIEILVNVDGVPIYKNSKQHFWPILLMIYHEDYYCSPAIVGMYSGDAKPAFANEFLDDFVTEASELIEKGLTIDAKNYTFKIKGFVCDTPARAFLKCCKGHAGFYACERCVTKGQTDNDKNVRVFPQTNCQLRTHESFRNKTQEEHHLRD